MALQRTCRFLDKKMFGEVLILGGLHGEGSGAEDLLVLHLVVEHEQGDRRL